MTAHYLRLLPFLADHAIRHGADDGRWAEEVFNDLTESGHVLTTVPLPDGHKGPVLGLCGDRFFGEVCRDDTRPDCLFLFKLWNADEKLPEVEPNRHKVGMRLFSESGADRPILDPVDALLSPLPKEPPEVGLPPPRAAFVEPSPELRAAVRNLDLDSIRRFCPGDSKNINSMDRKKWQDKLNTLRRRFDLKITLRDSFILKGDISPPDIDIELCRIGEAFDIAFLNSLGKAKRQRSLLLELLTLPAGVETTRRTLWLSWLSEQEPGTLKEELHVHAIAARLVPADNEPGPRLDSFLLKTLQEVGRRNQDESLLNLVEKAADSDTPWNVIADWASALVVRGTPPSRPNDVADFPEGNGILKAAIESIEEKPARGADQATSDAISGSETETHITSEIVPPKLSLTPKSERDRLASWIIAQHLSIIDVVEEVTKPRQEAEQLLKTLRDEPLDTHSLKELRNALSSLQEATEHALRIVPTLEEIGPLITEAAELVATLEHALGRDPLPFLDQKVSLDALREVASSKLLISVIRALPDWAGYPIPEGIRENSTCNLLIQCLREDKFRQDVERLGESLTHSGEDIGKLLGSLPPPSSETAPVDYLSDWANQATEALIKIRTLSGPAANWTMQTLTRWRQPRLASVTARRLGDLAGRVSAEVITALTKMIEAATDEESRLAVLKEAELTVEKIEGVFGAATTFTTEQWNQAKNGVKNDAIVPHRGTVRTGMDIAINHNYVDSAARRVDATYVPYDDPDMPYGSVTVPLTLQARTPVDVDLELELTVLTDQRKNWPSHWNESEPRSLRVRYVEWKEVEGGRYQWAFHATIPIRDPSSSDVRDEKFRVAVKVHNDSGESLLPEGTPPLVWDQLKTFQDMPELDWPDGVEPDYVKEHPVGGQTKAGEILKRLRNGGSFAMVAPRRFGKSTLIGYIAHEAKQDESGESKLLVLPPIACTSYRGNREAVWGAVHKRLVEGGTAGLTTTEYGDVPSTDAMKKAREIAWKMGYQGIVVLFDEAQLFFAGRDGHGIGDRLKDVLEREWTRQPEQGLASVQIGLVGLPSLLNRAGTNLMTALQVVESHVLRSEELNRILLAVSQGRIQTTRAARQELAHRTGNNLFILRTVVKRIHEQLNEEKRLWFNDRDVENAFSAARQSLESGSEWGIGHYLRDSLNEAESVNEWQPKHCYPLAVALASVGQRAQSERRIDLAVEAVQRWCADLSVGEVAFEYTEERKKMDLEALRELGVYNGGFHSELLEGYLRYVAGAHFPREEDTQAIIRCGVERVREPKPLELVVEGGQAKIYRFNRDNTTYAWRQIELPDSHAHEVFLATKEALHKLRDLRYEEGSQYLYDLRQVGISENGYGVEVYRWINGISLDEWTGTFSETAVVDVGFRIGQAIKLIHEYGVLHRDISPRNIILTDDAVPVLVDFGLARTANRKMSTVIGGEDAPPEVQSDSPDWTKAADIYGFGITLRQLLKAEERKAGSLYDLLELCLSRDPEQRPDAGELLNKLEKIRRQLHVQHIRDEAWRKIEKVAKQSETNRQFQDLLLKFRPQFEGIAIGLYPYVIDRCAEMAAFLDQTLEAFSRPNEDLKLGSIKRNGLRDVVTGLGIDFAYLLRLEKSHFLSSKRKEQKLREFGMPDDQRMREFMIEATEQIGQGLHLPQLVKVVETALA